MYGKTTLMRSTLGSCGFQSGFQRHLLHATRGHNHDTAPQPSGSKRNHRCRQSRPRHCTGAYSAYLRPLFPRRRGARGITQRIGARARYRALHHGIAWRQPSVRGAHGEQTLFTLWFPAPRTSEEISAPSPMVTGSRSGSGGAEASFLDDTSRMT